MSSRLVGASSPTTRQKAFSPSPLSTSATSERAHTGAAQGEVSKQRRKIHQPETPAKNGWLAHDLDHQESKSMSDSGIAAQNGSLRPASQDRIREEGAVRGAEQLELREEETGERVQATSVTDPKLHSGPAKLVMAFDIGTTYSGISYCIHEPGTLPETLAVTRFPAMELVRSYAKVPSLLYYDKGGDVKATGFEVLTESVIEVALKEGWMKAEWWKLYLRPKHIASSINPAKDLPPLPSGKSAVDVLTDFIRYLSKCAKSYIQEHHTAFVWSTVENSIEYIFTHPNGWEGVQQRYRQAIEDAGLVPSTPHGRSRVRMLTEGEASLHFCITKFLNVEIANQAAPRGVVIIDAGGGTIDSNVLSVTSNPVYCKEIAPAECRLQGSVFVTRRAKALLQSKLEGWEHSSKAISEITHEFDRSAKLVIKNDQEPTYVTVAGRRYNNSKYNISFGKLKLSGEEATSLFDDSVDAIIEAFEKQKKSAKMPITTAFLVGGFSANDWLWSRLQSYFNVRNVSAYRPDNHTDKAVAHGAVLCHIARDNPLIAPQIGRSACDVIERAIQNMKPGTSDLWEKAALDALRSLRVRGEGLGSRIAYLENENESLREVRRAHDQKHDCEVLYAEGRVHDAVDSLIEILNSAGEAVRANKVINDWLPDFQCRCREELEKRGDSAVDCKNYIEAAKHFSMILSLDLVDRVDILIKRSKARALMESWNEALSDADEVINFTPSSYRGYEMRYAVLHGAGRHAEAVEAFDVMLSHLEGSPDVEVRKLRRQYVDARPTIRHIVEVTIRSMPRVLIDTTTGRLYDKQRQAEIFETLPIYSELVSSMTTKLDRGRIRGAVQEFYRYVMLSHKWEHGEPLLQSVGNMSIYNLEPSVSNVKLQKFCLLVRYLGFRWAWSDTCCIDKLNNVVLQESLVAMFTWYRGSSITIVYLRGVLSQSQLPGGLRESIWNTRAWTYQEYVAAQTILFYTEDWEPYLGLTLSNHKESLAIISEMQQATRVSEKEMAVLRPGLDRARQKLYLASRRRTELVEDAAYSLFGIFNVALPVIYGEGNRAVGRLLEHVLTGSGDVTILAWTGASGDYNSCLPRDLTVYNSLIPPHVPQPIEKAEMDYNIKKLRSSLPVMTLYQRLVNLPGPSLAASRLKLSGVASTIIRLIRTSELYSETDVRWYIYRATTSIFGDIEIKTAEDLSGPGMEDLCVVHPWIRPLLDQEHLRGTAAPDKTTRALRLVARLRQPFGALLFMPLSRVEYRRVAADSFIIAQISQKVSLESLMDAICTIEIH